MPKFNVSFFYDRRNLYILGLLIAFAVTFSEVFRGRHMNFVVFADSTFDFWNGISPYSENFVSRHCDRFFLYSPVFSVLFTPFAYLPSWLGPFVWNIFNYTLFFLSVFSLPPIFSHEQKCRIFLYILPILGQSLFSFQYNVPVVYMFLFAYSLLESGRGFWAVLLIMVSGCTKIYGIFELALLVCYPRFLRNVCYAALIGGSLFLLPLLKLPPWELVPYYGEWFESLGVHHFHSEYDSLFHAKPMSPWLKEHCRFIQIGVLGLLAVLFLSNSQKWGSRAFRAQALGVLMGWVVLFSDSAELHTYIIALTGFMLWYYSRRKRTLTDKILFWLCFFMLCIVPIDVIVPVPFMHFLTKTICMNIWVFFITWVRMAWLTFSPSSDK